MKAKFRLLVAVSVLVLASLACQTLQPGAAVPPVIPALPQATSAPVSAAPVMVDTTGLFQEQEALVALYERVTPGIVSIQVTTTTGGSLGTGFVIDSDGHIVTNAHVVEGQTAIEIDFASGFKAYGKLVGIDENSDLAVIKVDAPASEIVPLTLGSSSQLKVGQKVIAIGNPFGLSGTMTTGIVSALGRTLPSNNESPGGGFFSAGDLIQTDAAINPGNSGGPLFNLNGEVVGVNRAIRTEASNSTGEPVNSGIGFAIAIDIVKRVAPAIIATGKYDYPYLGIASLPDDAMSLEVIKALDLKSMTGVYVTDVVTGGPADNAGMQGASTTTSIDGLQGGGDLIVAIDGQPIKTFDDLMRYLFTQKSPGDMVIITVLRGEERVDLNLKLAARP